MLQNIGTMAYKSELHESSWVHLVFHVSCLKLIGEKLLVQTIFRELGKEWKEILEPKGVMEKRTW